jgi:hypothetical protein
LNVRITRFVLVLGVLALVAGQAAMSIPASAAGPTEALVTVGSPTGPFPQNKQNEPAIAVDPAHPFLLAAGSNDEIDLAGCNVGANNTCPFTQGVGVSGVYFSVNDGTSWTQPSYSGYSARTCLGDASSSTDTCAPLTPSQGGMIGTLPWYYENGIVSDGDPALSFGPAPGTNGGFSWANGSRLYYANLTSNFSTKLSDAGFKGVEGVGVSRLDVPANATAATVPSVFANKNSWMQPTVITPSNSSAAFGDKEQVWADDASSSPYFGNAYVCFGNYTGGPSAGSNTVREQFSSSTDGGTTWSTQVLQKNTSSSSGSWALLSGTSGCTIRTDSQGNVYVFWLGFNQSLKTQGIYMDVSKDGGMTFSGPQRIFTVVSTGILDPVQGRNTMDGVSGARADLSPAPSVDIANGSPDGSAATDRIVLTWVDGRDGLNNEHVMFATSTDGGATWQGVNGGTAPTAMETPGDRGFYSAAAISPDGSQVYEVYNDWTQPYKTGWTGSANARPLEGVLLQAPVSGGNVGSFTEIFRSATGSSDARGSSANALTDEFLGDYVYVAATNSYAAAVFNDVRNAADCPAVDQWRMDINTMKSPPAPPAPGVDCPSTFGNSDIYSVTTG